jgi:SAM-dependent methyltransferase
VYDAVVADYVAFVGTELGNATEDAVDRSMLAAFVELVGFQRRGLIADLGCGPGRVAAFLAREGLDVIGLDVSSEMVAAARAAHAHVRFEQGQLDDLPFGDDGLAGAVCWYSIIHTPPDRLDDVLGEIARVVRAEGLVLVAFQAGTGQVVVNTDAYGSGISLTRYLHDADEVARRLDAAGFDVHACTRRAQSLPHESGPQAFVIARHRYAI